MTFFVSSLNLTVSDLTPYSTYGLVVAAHTVGRGTNSKLQAIQTAEEG